MILIVGGGYIYSENIKSKEINTQMNSNLDVLKNNRSKDI